VANESAEEDVRIEPMEREEPRAKTQFTAAQEEAAAAVFAFAKSWCRALTRTASQMVCRCDPARDADEDEFQHEPDCPVAKMLQMARLIDEDGESKRAEVLGPRRSGCDGDQS